MDTSTIIKDKILTVVSAKIKKIVSPGQKSPPKYISVKALDIWPDFFKKYGKYIRSVGDDPLERWKVAIAIFRNYCLKRSIPPFDSKASSLNRDTEEYMRNRLAINRDKLFEKAVSTLSYLVKHKLVKKVIKETVAGVKYNKSKSVYSITTSSDLLLPKELNNKSKDIINAFKYKGFDKKKDELTYSIGTHKIIVTPGNKPDHLTLTNVMNFTPQHIKYILGIEDKDLKDEKFVIKNLSKEAKDFLKRDSLNTMIVSSVIKKLDFNEELPQQQKEMLDSTISNLKQSKIADIRPRFSLDTIRSLGNPLYQYNLVKSLIEIYNNSSEDEKKGVDINVWQSISENPDMFLNPDNIKKNDIKDSNDPDSNI